MKSLLLVALLVLSPVFGSAAESGRMKSGSKKIRVLVWDEQQPAQKTTYPDFLGNHLANHLKKVPGLEVRSAALNDPGKGISDESLDQCDVLVWWGHVRHTEITPAESKKIVDRIKAGKLSLIALHSAHWSEPFLEAMKERTRIDAAKLLGSKPKAKVNYVVAERFKLPAANGPLTPRIETNATGEVTVYLPNCVFPVYRADGAPSHVKTLRPKHPIAKGVPLTFDLPQTEMYGEPFHVPKPDAVIFEERWDKGEWFRSGCVWKVGKGKVFYFRPGHETYNVFHQPAVLKIMENAVKWAKN